MQRESDAKELYSLVHGVVSGGMPHMGILEGTSGITRGIREELLKQTGIVGGKIISSNLSEEDIDRYFALCQIAEANQLFSKTDIENIGKILDRSI
jgi:hypothetical protein